jgi:hypothetical protein
VVDLEGLVAGFERAVEFGGALKLVDSLASLASGDEEPAVGMEGAGELGTKVKVVEGEDGDGVGGSGEFGLALCRKELGSGLLEVRVNGGYVEDEGKGEGVAQELGSREEFIGGEEDLSFAEQGEGVVGGAVGTAEEWE